MNVFQIIAVVLVVDSIAAILLAFHYEQWYIRHMNFIAKYLPPARGWALWYFLLATFISYVVFTFT